MATRAVAVKNADRKTTIKEYPPLIPSQKRWDFYSILFAKYFPICKKISILVEVKMKIFYSGNPFYWYNLEGSNDNGEFSRKVLVNGSGPAFDAGGPADYATLKARSALTANGIKVTVPAHGAVIMAIDKK